MPISKVGSLILVLLVIGCAGPKSSVHKAAEFDADGNLIVDKTVSRTYSIPDIKAGYTYDMQFGRARPVLEVELLDKRLPILDATTVNVGAGEDLLFISIEKRLTSIFEVGVGVFGGYDTKEGGTTWGLMGSILKF